MVNFQSWMFVLGGCLLILSRVSSGGNLSGFALDLPPGLPLVRQVPVARVLCRMEVRPPTAAIFIIREDGDLIFDELAETHADHDHLRDQPSARRAVI